MAKVFLNVYVVGTGNVDSDLHIKKANDIYRDHGIAIEVQHKDNIPDAKIVNPMNGKFYESQLGMLASNSNLTQEKDCVDVYYLASFYSEDVRGVTVRPNGQPEGYTGRPPIRPVIVLNAIQTDPSTLAHELGHALLDDGSHVPDSANLMSAGGTRTGTTLTPDQVSKIKGSPYVKP